MMSPVALSAQEADYVSDNESGRTTGAVWTEIGATKILPYNLSLGLDAGFRTDDWFNEASRFDIGLGLSWKASKHWKFGISYTFIDKYYRTETATKTEYKYRPANASENVDFPDFMGGPFWNSYTYKGKNVNTRTTDSYWRAKHRISIDASYSYKFWKALRVTLRERYQLSLVPSKTVSREKLVDKYRDAGYPLGSTTNESNVTYDELYRYWQDGGTIYELDLLDAGATANNVTHSYLAEHELLNTTKTKSFKALHVLRSRLTFEIDKKGWKATPFAYFESFNNMGESWHFDKLRGAAGVDYALSKQHKVSLSYVFNHENDDDGDENTHALCVGYKFKF